VKVKPAGPTCHTGLDTCWQEANTQEFGFLSKLENTIATRKVNADAEKSYVASLFAKGINKIAQKVGEEAVEVVIEAKDNNNDLFLSESADLLFELYPEIQKGYNLTQDLRNIFEKTTDKIIGFAKLAKWHEKVNQSGFKSFNTISRTIINHYQTILNYFDNRSTNASAESFNAKIKDQVKKLWGNIKIWIFAF
jgi:phosphoribosyl-ATP pyrophosphohydrolase